MTFLPVSKEDLLKNGVETPDFVLVTGDAYVDHPSFGAAVIGRLLESRGYSVAVLAQPNWKDASAFAAFGKPRLGFLVTSGNLDSMVAKYTVAKRPRERDLYSPGGQTGLRPDRALIVYSNRIREAYKDAVIILGGLEASLRRLAHYDYWDNRVRRSVLLDSGADLLVYGMGERAVAEIAEALDSGLPAGELTFINGTVYKTKDATRAVDAEFLPSYVNVAADPFAFARSFLIQYKNTDPVTAKSLLEGYDDFCVVQNSPAAPLSAQEFDDIYELPYTRQYHPMYKKHNGVPALEEVKFSITSGRGCFGGCNFCSLTFHQGRRVQARSHESILREAEILTKIPDFKGYIHDVGGPTANFRRPSCDRQLTEGVCAERKCLAPKACPNLIADHSDYVALLKKLRNVAGVKKVFVRSGIRHDYVLRDKNPQFLDILAAHHVSGRLKTAPEHVSGKVLALMGKPNIDYYEKFAAAFGRANDKAGLNQCLEPYFMSSHPGSDLEAAVELAEYLMNNGIKPGQVQDFYPTPGTMSTCMYHTGLDPFTNEPVHVPRSPHEKAMQRALLQWMAPQNHALVIEALRLTGREDLIGLGKGKLVNWRPISDNKDKGKKKNHGGPDRKQRG